MGSKVSSDLNTKLDSPSFNPDSNQTIRVVAATCSLSAIVTSVNLNGSVLFSATLSYPAGDLATVTTSLEGTSKVYSNNITPETISNWPAANILKSQIGSVRSHLFLGNSSFVSFLLDTFSYFENTPINRVMHVQRRYLFFVFILFIMQSVYAAPVTFNFQARMKNSSGSGVSDPAVDFIFTYRNSANTCTIFKESFSSVDMSGSGGLVNLQLGSGTRTWPSSGLLELKDIFDNTGTVLNCLEGGTYTPTSVDLRLMIMQFNYATSGGWNTLSPISINSVPYSMYSTLSENTKLFDGRSLTDFLLKPLICNTGEVITFDGTNYVCQTGGGGGSVTDVTASAPLVSTAGVTPNISLAKASASADGYLSSSDFTTFSSKLSNFSTLTSADISAKYAYTPLANFSTMTSTDISAALAYEPVNRAGDTMSGSLNLPSNGLAVGTNQLVVSGGNVGIGTATLDAKLTVAGSIASVPSTIASGAVVDLSLSSSFILSSVGGGATATIALSNIAHGGMYNIVVADTTERTYDFSGCTNKYWKPAQGPTTLGSQTVFGILAIKTGGSNYNCYITWSTGYL